MTRIRLAIVAIGWIVALTAAATNGQAQYPWRLPRGFPAPDVPADNPISEAKVQLGRYLFYDARLSGNGTQSCATCHAQSKAFTDGRARSIGSTGEEHPRGSMSLVNVAYATVLNWATLTSRLEDQALVPMYGDHPVELGLDRADTWLRSIERDATYRRLFADAFPGQTAVVTSQNVTKAIATFERAIVSARSPYDRYHFDRDDNAVSDAAKRGEILFHSRPLSCFTCHGGVNFSNAMGSGGRMGPPRFENTGLYNLAGLLSYPAGNTGLHAITGDAADVGRFKPPTLRNIALTAPYMHDGSVATLEDAIDHYAAGGRTIASGPMAGVGRENPNKNPSIRGFDITPTQKADLIEFLRSLTDTDLVTDQRFANPWPARR